MNTMFNTLLVFGLGTSEIIVVALILLLLFGGKKIPELMRGLGRGVKEFNNAKDGMRDEIRKGMSDDAPSNSEKES
ncbi:MAG: Sec-independent protein translocase subunit TatA/TatB [Bacteroidia bacterium]|jgi:sec-independent protein translocase protein TatA